MNREQFRNAVAAATHLDALTATESQLRHLASIQAHANLFGDVLSYKLLAAKIAFIRKGQKK